MEEQIKVITDKLSELLSERDKINSDLVDLETKKNLSISEVEKIGEQIESFKARRKDIEPQLEETKQILESAGVNISNLEPVEMSIDEITSRIQRLQKRMDDLGAVNMRALEEFERVQSRQQELQSQIDTLSNERIQILDRMKGYEDLKKESVVLILLVLILISRHYSFVKHQS